MTHRQRARAFKALYASLPTVKCQQKCANRCGPILFSDTERTTIEKRAGRQLTIAPHPLSPPGLPMCSMLTHDGKCSVYDVRPMICRLWGAVPEMPCEHGCEVVNPVPEGRVFDFLRQAMALGGDKHATALKPYIDLIVKTCSELAGRGAK